MKKYAMNLEEVGGRLKAIRGHLGLSMERLRQITGYSKALISAAENGLKKPSTIYLYALYDKFNVNIHYVFGGSGPMFLEEEKEIIPAGEASVDSAAGESVSGMETLGDDARELIYLIKNVDMVRYTMLGHFIQYKTQNHLIINQLLEEKRKKQDLKTGTEDPEFEPIIFDD